MRPGPAISNSNQQPIMNSLTLLLTVCLSTTPLFADNFSNWASDEFELEELSDATITAPEADPDGDGMINLLEYAFGTDPLYPDRSDATFSPKFEGGKLVLEFNRDTEKSDLTVSVEMSNDLLTWSPVSSELLSVRKGIEKRRAVIDLSQRGFLRLRITRP